MKLTSWIILILTILLLSTSCVHKTNFYILDRNGNRMKKIAEIHQTTSGLAKYQFKDGTVIEVDTRDMNFWQENVIPIFQKTIDTAQSAAVSVK